MLFGNNSQIIPYFFKNKNGGVTQEKKLLEKLRRHAPTKVNQEKTDRIIDTIDIMDLKDFMDPAERQIFRDTFAQIYSLILRPCHILICIYQNGSVACQPSAGEEGGMVALSHLPPFLGFEQKYLYGQMVYNWIVISKFMKVVVSTSDAKKAPPYLERLQKEHCSFLQLFATPFGISCPTQVYF